MKIMINTVNKFFKHAEEMESCSIICSRKLAKKIVFEAIEREKTFFEDIDGKDWIRYTFAESGADIVLIETVKIDGGEWFVQPYKGEYIETNMSLIQNEIKPLIDMKKINSEVVITVD